MATDTVTKAKVATNKAATAEKKAATAEKKAADKRATAAEKLAAENRRAAQHETEDDTTQEKFDPVTALLDHVTRNGTDADNALRAQFHEHTKGKQGSALPGTTEDDS